MTSSDDTSDVLRNGIESHPVRSQEEIRRALKMNSRALQEERMHFRKGDDSPEEEESEDDSDSGEVYDDPTQVLDGHDYESDTDIEEDSASGEVYDDPTQVLSGSEDLTKEISNSEDLTQVMDDSTEAMHPGYEPTRMYTEDELRGYANIADFVRDQGVSPTFPSNESLTDGVNGAPSWWPGGGAVKRQWYYVDDVIDRTERTVLIAKSGFVSLANGLWDEKDGKGYRLDPMWMLSMGIITAVLSFAVSIIIFGFTSFFIFIAVPLTIILNLGVMKFLGSKVRTVELSSDVRYFKVLACVQEQASDMGDKIRRRQALLAGLQKMGDGDTWMSSLVIKNIAILKSEHKKLMDWSTS